MRARTLPKRVGLIAPMFLCLALVAAACPGTGTETSGVSDQGFTIRVPGDTGQSFTGSYVLLKADGNIITSQFEGTAPYELKVEGLQVDITVQKTAATGYLEVQILRGRSVVAEGDIPSAFGSITLSGR